jgi:hypothetical protein
MAITNELSSEIAAAILAKKKSPTELKQLHDVMLRIHATLQKMQQYTSIETSTPLHQTAKQSKSED